MDSATYGPDMRYMAFKKYVYHLFILIATILEVTSEENFQFDNKRGSEHEFKIAIPPTREECFFQYVRINSQVHVSYEVLRGADRNVDFTMKTPRGNIFASKLWSSEGVVDRIAEEEGTYAICIDNTFSRYSTKVVHLFIVTYVTSDWQEYAQELEMFEISIDSFISALSTVDNNINQMLKSQAASRITVIKDWYLANSTKDYVRNVVLVMIALIIGTSTLQVYFVRKLFTVKDVRSTSSKPRA